jgi:hypothetical protein
MAATSGSPPLYKSHAPGDCPRFGDGVNHPTPGAKDFTDDPRLDSDLFPAACPHFQNDYMIARTVVGIFQDIPKKPIDSAMAK